MISHIMIRATYFHNNVFINMICAGRFRCSERCVTNVYKQHYRKYFKITQYFNIDHIKVTRLGFPVKIDKPCRHWMCIYIQYIYIFVQVTYFTWLAGSKQRNNFQLLLHIDIFIINWLTWRNYKRVDNTYTLGCTY